MPLALPTDLEQYVQQEVRDGRYESVEKMVEAALRLLQTREQRLEALRAEILLGLDQLDRGEGAPLDMAAIKDRIRHQLAAEAPGS